MRQGLWKLALMTQGNAHAKGQTEDDAKTNPRLYNLDQEINERANLAAQHPDIVAKLTALAEKMTAEIGGNEPKNRRPPGEAENPVTLYTTTIKSSDSTHVEGRKATLEELEKAFIEAGFDVWNIHPANVLVTDSGLPLPFDVMIPPDSVDLMCAATLHLWDTISGHPSAQPA